MTLLLDIEMSISDVDPKTAFRSAIVLGDPEGNSAVSRSGFFGCNVDPGD